MTSRLKGSDESVTWRNMPSASRQNTIRLPCSAPEPWARKSPHIWATPDTRSSLLDVSAAGRARGTRARTQAQTRPFFSPDAVGSHPDRRLRLGSRVDRAGRLDYRSHHRTGGREAVAPRASRRAATRRIDRQLEHIGAFDCRPRRRAQRRFSPALARHAFFQSASIPAAARDHSDGETQIRQSSRTVREFADRRLGKNVVVAKDTPGFIANHVAMHGLVRIFEALAAGTYTVEEIDAMTGAAIGRPKSATFRTVDIAGLDILVHVANDLAARLPQGRGSQFRFPPFVQEMLARGWIGEKAGRGFYERRKTDSGETDIWALDPANDGVSAATACRSCRRSTRPRRCRCRSACGSSLQETIASPSFFARRCRRPCGTPPRLLRRSRIRSTTSIARCVGGTAGRSVRSSWPMRLG